MGGSALGWIETQVGHRLYLKMLQAGTSAANPRRQSFVAGAA
jgi:hypothetical protein